MKKALRNELLTVCGLAALGALALRRPRVAAGFGIAATGAVLLTEPEFSFRGANVVITGGSRGLGLALAKELVKENAMITLLARDRKELDRARQLLMVSHPQARIHTIACDVTLEDQLSKALEESTKVFGEIDVLINNAGAIIVGPLESLTRQDFEAQLELHLYAVMSAVKWVLPSFFRRGRGRIINICSMGGKVAVPHMLPYDTSKFALAGFSQGLAAEVERENIVVTTVYPTLMHTGSPIQAVFKGDYEKEYAWFATGDNFPGVSMPAVTAAKKILQASREGKRELIPTTIGKARMGLSFIFPEIAIAIMALMNRLMPKSNLAGYHTGAQSRDYVDSKFWGKFFKKRATQAEREYNQEEKEDAKRNMGLLH